jgi:hypothetical protein
MLSHDLGQAFLNRDVIPGVFFFHNDFVRVVAGPYKGGAGSLVTVLQVNPEPHYLLELESGYDVEVAQSEIENADV